MCQQVLALGKNVWLSLPMEEKKNSLLAFYWDLSGLALSFLLFPAITCLKWLNKVNHFVLVYELYFTILFVVEMSSGK